MPDCSLFGASPDELLISAYARQGRTLDDLPYTPQFEAIYAAMGDETISRADLFHRLHNLRKAKNLPRLGRAATPPLRVSPEHQSLLARLVEREVGRLSLRDQLLYAPAFDRIALEFNAAAGLNLSAHDIWRVIAKLAK